MFNFVRNFFSVNRMLKSNSRGKALGDIPKSVEIYRTLAKIAIPSVIEMVFMSIVGSVDMVMLRGLENPAGAIAAVGLASQPRMLTLVLFFAINTGVTAIVARRKGEGEKDSANRALRNAIMLISILSVFVVAVTLLWSRPLLLLAGAKPDTIDMSNEYFRIMTYFTPIAALTLCINAAQRGVGNTRTTMYVNLTSNVVNVILDIFMIYGLKASNGTYVIPAMGVAGDAWATGIGICVGFILCLLSVAKTKRKDKFLQLSLSDKWAFHRVTVESILKIGGNAAIEQVAIRVGFFAYAAIVASLGTQAVAAHHVGMQFLSLSFTFGDGLSVAAASLVGQMLGQKRADLATIYAKCAQRVALLVGIFLATLIVTFRAPLIKIFLDADVPANLEAFAMAMDVLIVVGLFQPIQMANVVIASCLRGAGDNLHVALIMIICVVVIRPGLSFSAVNFFNLGIIGAWSSSLIDMSIRLTLMNRRFKSGKWQLIKV